MSQEDKSIKHLLIPRKKVIADWPANTFDIGQILVKSDLVEDWLQTDNFLHGVKLSSAEKFPIYSANLNGGKIESRKQCRNM